MLHVISCLNSSLVSKAKTEEGEPPNSGLPSNNILHKKNPRLPMTQPKASEPDRVQISPVSSVGLSLPALKWELVALAGWFS